MRFYVNNAGDNEVAFHIVGEQLDKVMVGRQHGSRKSTDVGYTCIW